MSAASYRPENVPLLNLDGDVMSPTSKRENKIESFISAQDLKKFATSESWIPVSLHRRTFFCFATAFLTAIIALGVLFNYSNKHNGLATSNQSLHYLWTFRPTAIFTIIAALWAGVEYHTKQLAPWRALANGPSTAKRTMLRDYVSPWVGEFLTTSIKSGDYDVTLGITGGLLLQLLIVFSTGLLALEPHTMSRENVALTAMTKFTTMTRDVSARPFSDAVVTQLYGLDQPHGATDTFAYQTLNTSHLLPNVTVTATVDALYPDLNCTAVPANWTMYPDTTSSMWIGYYSFTINITDPACPHTTGFHGSTLDEISQYSIMDETSKCIQETATNYTIRPGQRWWIWVSHDAIDYHRNISFTSPFLNTTYPASQPSVSTIACEPTVQMRKALVTTDGIIYNATLTNDAPTPMKLNISAWDMQSSVLDSDNLAGETFQGAPSGALHVPDDFFMSKSLYLLMNASDPRRTYQDWMDTKDRKASTKRSLRGSFKRLRHPSATPHALS